MSQASPVTVEWSSLYRVQTPSTSGLASTADFAGHSVSGLRWGTLRVDAHRISYTKSGPESDDVSTAKRTGRHAQSAMQQHDARQQERCSVGSKSSRQELLPCAAHSAVSISMIIGDSMSPEDSGPFSASMSKTRRASNPASSFGGARQPTAHSPTTQTRRPDGAKFGGSGGGGGGSAPEPLPPRRESSSSAAYSDTSSDPDVSGGSSVGIHTAQRPSSSNAASPLRARACEASRALLCVLPAMSYSEGSRMFNAAPPGCGVFATRPDTTTPSPEAAASSELSPPRSSQGDEREFASKESESLAPGVALRGDGAVLISDPQWINAQLRLQANVRFANGGLWEPRGVYFDVGDSVEVVIDRRNNILWAVENSTTTDVNITRPPSHSTWEPEPDVPGEQARHLGTRDPVGRQPSKSHQSAVLLHPTNPKLRAICALPSSEPAVSHSDPTPAADSTRASMQSVKTESANDPGTQRLAFAVASFGCSSVTASIDTVSVSPVAPFPWSAIRTGHGSAGSARHAAAVPGRASAVAGVDCAMPRVDPVKDLQDLAALAAVVVGL